MNREAARRMKTSELIVNSISISKRSSDMVVSHLS